MAVQDAIERIQYHARLVSGIRAAPDNVDLPAANHEVFAFTYLKDGEMGVEAHSQGRDIHNLETQITYTGGDALNIEKHAEAALEAFVNLLRGDPLLNSKVDTIDFPIRYSVSRESEGNVKKLVFTITTRVKIRPTFTVTS